MLNLSTRIKLQPESSRVRFMCEATGITQIILLDTGSPNTIITLDLANQLGLKSRRSDMAQIHLVGQKIDVVPVVLPNLVLGDLRLERVKVYAGLGLSWGRIMLLGLNVLNQMVYTIDRREGSGFIEISLPENPAPDAFNRLIGRDGKYYIIDLEESENGTF